HAAAPHLPSLSLHDALPISLTEGAGTLDTQSGAFAQQPYSFKGRFQDEAGKSGTNPEELIAAAHAGCFAMQLSHFLAENGTPAEDRKSTRLNSSHAKISDAV